MNRPCPTSATAREPVAATPKDKAIKYLSLALTRLIVEAVDSGRLTPKSRTIKEGYAALQYARGVQK